MMFTSLKKLTPAKITAAAFLASLPVVALAQSMPWEGPICKISTSFSGPVAVSLVVLAVVLCGAAFAFGELNGIFKSILSLAMGGSMAVGAIQWTTIFTGGTYTCGSSWGAIPGSHQVASVATDLLQTLSALV